ncbi:pectinesterase-like [Salvia miltiorrhiza]|uniref:pectinesterase-like n=1 Tax=Salvia miltiorrhiza TaxID=226208 RepID=UPI0025AD58D0|nr:pectinesterase-like [Salvia miltiorrhiza]
MGEPAAKKKGLIAAAASILLVAAVVVAVVTTSRGGSGGGGRGSGATDVESTTRSIAAICAPTQYQETCHASLDGANTTDPKKLIETAIDVAVDKVSSVLKQSKLLQEAAADPMTKQAFDVCREVLEKAVDDLKRTVEQIDAIDAAEVKEYVADLRTWLSAVVTNQETCLDAFENTTGDAGQKMRNLLRTARELSSNGLAMVTDISEFVGALQLEEVLGSGRKLAARARDEDFVERRLVQATALSLKPTIVVAKDGSGKFNRINDAVASLPKRNNDSFIVIHIKAGVYNENVDIPKGLNKIVFIGDGPNATRITGKRSVAAGVQTYYTPTLAINGEDFVAKDIGVENTAGPDGFQALAVRVSGDRAILYNVHMDGYQDTLCADTHRQYYRNCTISGTIDFVFGNGLALFQNCKFVVRKPGPKQECMVTAQGRNDPKSNTAIIIQNGKFAAEPALLAMKPPVPSYLGRPWKELSRTIIIQSDIEGFINKTGWARWIDDIGLNTCYYVEFGNRGPGANTTGRVTWKGIRKLTAEQVRSWTGGVVYGGDTWIKESGVPYIPTMMPI